jgi:hypothetical protein
MSNRSQTVDAAQLRRQSARCLDLAATMADPEVAALLRNMAMSYQSVARRLEALAHGGACRRASAIAS